MFDILIIDDTDTPKDARLPRVPVAGDEIIWTEKGGSSESIRLKVTKVEFCIPAFETECDNIIVYADTLIYNGKEWKNE